MAVPSDAAAQLKSDASIERATPASPWPITGSPIRRLSPYAFAADAAAEAARVVQMMGGPCVVDRLSVPGRQHHLIGRGITIHAEALDYASGRECFVIGAAEGLTDTVLTIVRPLA